MPSLAPPVRPVASHPRTPPAPPRALRVAYLTTEYPKVSHAFIRREIAELERRGHHVERLSVRPPGGPLVDPADRAEAERTLSCLGRSKLRLLAHAAAWATRRPSRFAVAAATARRFYCASDRGLVRHIAYLAEAAYLADHLRRKGIGHVHVHFGTNAATVAVLMKVLSGITYSLTVHGPGEFDAPVGLGLAAKVAGAEFTAAISHFGRAQLQRWVGPDHWERIHVVRCTVNPELLAPPPPTRPHLRPLAVRRPVDSAEGATAAGGRVRQAGGGGRPRPAGVRWRRRTPPPDRAAGSLPRTERPGDDHRVAE